MCSQIYPRTAAHILPGTKEHKTGSSLFSSISKTTGEGGREDRKSWLCQFSAAKEKWEGKLCLSLPSPHPHFSEAAVTSHMWPFPGPSSCAELCDCTCWSLLPAGAFAGAVMAQQLRDPGSANSLVQGFFHHPSEQYLVFSCARQLNYQESKASLDNSYSLHSAKKKKKNFF